MFTPNHDNDYSAFIELSYTGCTFVVAALHKAKPFEKGRDRFLDVGCGTARVALCVSATHEIPSVGFDVRSLCITEAKRLHDLVRDAGHLTPDSLVHLRVADVITDSCSDCFTGVTHIWLNMKGSGDAEQTAALFRILKANTCAVLAYSKGMEIFDTFIPPSARRTIAPTPKIRRGHGYGIASRICVLDDAMRLDLLHTMLGDFVYSKAKGVPPTSLATRYLVYTCLLLF